MKLAFSLVWILLGIFWSNKTSAQFPASAAKNTPSAVQLKNAGGCNAGLFKSTADYLEYFYDDGVAENYCAWQLAGNMLAVKYTPHSSTLSVVGAKIYVGNGAYPVGGNILGQPYRVSVYDNDGDNGMPGTLIDSISGIVTNYEWVSLTGMDAPISHDFYIVVTQLSDAPDCIPIGVDETQPKANQSYSRNVVNTQPWVQSTYQDLMIRALLTISVGTRDNIDKGIQLYPNPASASVHLVFTRGIEAVYVYNMSGQIVFNTDCKNRTSLIINTSGFESGVYYVKFQKAGGYICNKKLLVMH